jgi:hypothetical protein
MSEDGLLVSWYGEGVQSRPNIYPHALVPQLVVLASLGMRCCAGQLCL